MTDEKKGQDRVKAGLVAIPKDHRTKGLPTYDQIHEIRETVDKLYELCESSGVPMLCTYSSARPNGSEKPPETGPMSYDDTDFGYAVTTVSGDKSDMPMMPTLALAFKIISEMPEEIAQQALDRDTLPIPVSLGDLISRMAEADDNEGDEEADAPQGFVLGDNNKTKH